MKYIKPRKLKTGDTIAILSPSWAWPSIFPEIYQNGIRTLESLWFKIQEYPTTKANHDFLSNHPELRAKDINDAFADTRIQAIIASIGWDDSVRILPFLNTEIIRNNPKIFMGYSDTTILLAFLNQLGLVTFHGPAVMSGFSQMNSLGEDYIQHLKDILFTGGNTYQYRPYWYYHEGYPDWSNAANIWKVNNRVHQSDWKWLQGEWIVQGNLFGWCLEVLEFMKATDFWPNKNFWKNKVLFFETSEEKPSINQVRYILRNYWMQWVFGKISGLIFGRARDYSQEEKVLLDTMIQDVISREFWQLTLPILTHVDFWHTDPQIILPLWALIELDYHKKSLSLIRPWVQ
jgi:muramoyltetrapeptide carboxypeptidase LdcA involved in peptidoglycan recycling